MIEHVGRKFTEKMLSQKIPAPPLVIATLRSYVPPVPELTCTVEPLVAPTNEAPELFDMNDQLKVGLARFVEDESVFVVPAQTGLGPKTLQVTAASAFIDRSWLPPWPSTSKTRMWYGDPPGCAAPSQSALLAM